MTPEALRVRIARFRPGARSSAQAGTDAIPRGDHDLNDGLEPMGNLRQAAVLVPVIDRAQGLTLLFTERSPHLADHAGQISFPGGRLAHAAESPEAAALREAAEEIGLGPESVEILGRLDTYITRTGFEIVPVIGLVRPPFSLTPDPSEVAGIFEVPLAFFLDPGNRRRDHRLWQGARRYFYAYQAGDHYIWGATAGMLNNLAEWLA